MGIEAPTPEQIESAEWVSKNAVGSDATVYFQAIEPEVEEETEETEEAEAFEETDLTVSDE